MVDPVSFGPVGPLRARKEPALEFQAKRMPELVSIDVAGPSLPKLLKVAAELASQGPPVDAAKIAHIRQAIADGSYKVDPDLIADAMSTYYGGRIA